MGADTKRDSTFDSTPDTPGSDVNSDTADAGPAMRAFVSSGQYDGDLETAASTPGQGALSGDAICQQLADAQSLGGKWVAWLSDSTHDVDDRLIGSSWVNLNGETLFFNRASLFFGFSDAWTFENGNETFFSPPEYVWTGTERKGIATVDTCSDWSTTSSAGTVGDATTDDGQWTESTELPCVAMHRLYCFEMVYSGLTQP